MSDEMKALVQEQFSMLRSERDALRAQRADLLEALRQVTPIARDRAEYLIGEWGDTDDESGLSAVLYAEALLARSTKGGEE